MGTLVYSNSFHSPFQFDEPYFLVKNPIVKDPSYFLHPSRTQGVDPNYSFFLKTRYIAYLTFMINYKIHGFDVFGFHVFNLMIHLLNGIWIYWLILRTFQTPFLKGSFLENDGHLMALFVSLLFVSHPIQTEAVTYIFQRQASLVTFFYLLSILFYMEGRLLPKGNKSSFLSSKFFFVASFLSTLIAMKTKENAITLPVIITIYEFFFFTGKVRTRILRLIPWLSTMVIIPVTLMQIKGPFFFDPSRVSRMVNEEVTRETYLFTQFRVIVTYIRLLLFPVHQSFDYDYPIYRSLFVDGVFLSLLFHLALLGFAVYLLYRSRVAIRELRLVSFGVLWFYITLSVESSVIPLPMMICEYRVYLASAGWITATVVTAWIASERLRPRLPGLRKGVIIFFAFTTVLLSVLTYTRNGIWGSNVSLWEDVTRKSPNNARGHYNLALILVKNGRFNEAEPELLKVLQLNPSDLEAWKYLGLIYDHKNQPDRAIGALQSALKLDPNDADVHYNLGNVYQREGRLEDATREYQVVLGLNWRDAGAHNNLGVIYAREGRVDEAVKEFETALRIDPQHGQARRNLDKIRGIYVP